MTITILTIKMNVMSVIQLFYYRTEQNRIEQNRIEQNKTEQKRTKQNRREQSCTV